MATLMFGLKNKLEDYDYRLQLMDVYISQVLML